jgi:hypothetical protein
LATLNFLILWASFIQLPALCFAIHLSRNFKARRQPMPVMRGLSAERAFRSESAGNPRVREDF